MKIDSKLNKNCIFEHFGGAAFDPTAENRKTLVNLSFFLAERSKAAPPKRSKMNFYSTP